MRLCKGEYVQKLNDINRVPEEKSPLIILDIPLLYEEHYENLVDEVMVVYVDADVQNLACEVETRSRGLNPHPFTNAFVRKS